ncbi:MAG: hypothetical protein ACRC9L_01595 [Brevinema sp.]
MRRNFFAVGLLVLLAGCSLAREQAFNLGYKDRRVIDNLKKQALYSIDEEGVYNQKNHDLIVFDGDLLLMTFTSVVNGVEQGVSEYSVEVVEDISSSEGIFRLYGSGPLSGKYIGMQILTNFNGAYAKLNFQDTQSGAIEAARSMPYWNWVTDPLVFRSFKSFPVGTPVVYLSDPLAPVDAVDGVDASTRQQQLRFIKLANPLGTHHTNMVVSIDSKGTATTVDDSYQMTFNTVVPVGNRTNLFVTYEILTVKLMAPNTEIYGVRVVDVGTTGSSPIGGTPLVGATGFIAVEFYSDSDRSKVAARIAFETSELNALASMRAKPLYRWETLSTADLPTRVFDRFKGEPLVQVFPYVSDEITPAGGGVNNLPLTYNWENTREFHFNTTNFTVRVLDVRNRTTNSVNYRFQMIDDVSTNEGIVQLQGAVGSLAGQYFHIRHYYPSEGEMNHGYHAAATPNTFEPSTGVGDTRPVDDTRLIVKIGQGSTEAIASAMVTTSDNTEASNIIYQSKTNAYKPQRLLVDMNKRGSSWAGVLDDGTYSPDSATNILLNAVARTLQVRITTNAPARFSTYRFFVVENISDTRLVAVLSNIPNTTTAIDKHNGFFEPSMDVAFSNPDNDAVSQPFHTKYVAFILGSGVDSTRAKIEFADTKEEALRKVDNRSAWNLYESTAIPTPNRIIKTLAGISPLVRLDRNGYYDATHTEQLKFDADDMAVTISWHRSRTAASLDLNVVAAARYTIPLPLIADTSLQEGVFSMIGGAATNIRVVDPAGGYYPTPETALDLDGSLLEGLNGEYRYASTGDTIYSVIVGTLADANKVRAGRGATRDIADAARLALTAPNWHTLADAPLSPDVFIQLMESIENYQNLPYVMSVTGFQVDATGRNTSTYQPYDTYEFEFTINPSLQMTVRQKYNTQTTTAVFPLLIVNNISKYDTIARVNGSGSMGNVAPGRFMRIRIPTDADVNATPPRYVTNATVSFYANRADAELDRNPVTSGSSLGRIPAGSFDSQYNIRHKTFAIYPLTNLPNNKTYQSLILPQLSSVKNYDTYQIFNPRVLDTVLISFKDVTVDGDERISIKPANAVSAATYQYEVIYDTMSDPTWRAVFVRLIGEGQLYHNRFVGFRFSDNVTTGSPDKMHAVIGETDFVSLLSKMIALRGDESINGWEYADTEKLYDKDIKTFKSASAAYRGVTGVTADRVGSFVTVNTNGVYNAKETDIYNFTFTGSGQTATNMILDITTRKADGTDIAGRYYFIPLVNTPANAAPDFGDSDPTTTTPAIERGQIMYGYLISFNYGVDGSTALVPFNNHFAIVRTDTVDGTTSDPTGTVRSVIVATNALALGTPADTPKGSGAATAYEMYNYWFQNGVNPRGSSVIPLLAFNLRDRVTTDINSRVIEFFSSNPWVSLTNFETGTFSDGTARVAYTLHPKNHRRYTFDNFNRVLIVTNVKRPALTGTTAPTFTYERYSINVREVVSDYAAVVQLAVAPNTAFPSVNAELDQRYVYLEMPAGDTAAATDQRTRDARIIIAGEGPENTVAAVKALRDSIHAENEWNVANMDYALNQLDTSVDVAGISEKAFRTQHILTPAAAGAQEFSFYYTYSPAGNINPTNDTIAAQTQWNPDNWLAFRPIIRKVGTAESIITNFEIARHSGANSYNYTNVLKVIQADDTRTIFQLAGTQPQTQITPENISLSNLFMAVEYGTGINDRTAKVVFSDTRTGVMNRLNAKTTYNYFQGMMATNSGDHEEIVNQVIVANRGVEWVTVSNSIHNTVANGGLTGQYGSTIFDPAMDIKDDDDYTKPIYSTTATTNFILDPINKTIQEYRIVPDTSVGGGVSRTNTFVYGYTVIESSFEPSLSTVGANGLPTAPNTREDNLRYQLVVRLEGFGDYKNLFLAAEVGRFDATQADNISGHDAQIVRTDSELERFKARLIFGETVNSAKAALEAMRTRKSWNLIARARLTKPSALINSVDPARLGLFQTTGDQTITGDGTNSSDYYARLVTATGAESNVIDIGNHTNFVFHQDATDIPYVTVVSIQSNVPSQVRYRIEVAENFLTPTTPVSRRSNDVVVILDNAGSALHGKVVGIRRHSAQYGTIDGAVFSMVIGGTVVTNAAGVERTIPNTTAAIVSEMSAIDVTDTAALEALLPITLRYSNDIARVPGGVNDSLNGNDFISLLSADQAGIFSSLDGDRVYMSSSNATWNYNNTTKLMTITYTAPGGGRYEDPISSTEKANNSSEAYRVIPVMTLNAPSGTPVARGQGVVLLRSDENSGTRGFLHNKYVSIIYHGTPRDTAIEGAYSVFLTNASTLREATNLMSDASSAALYTVLTPYTTLDLTPLNTFLAINNPDNATMLPSTWAFMQSSVSTNNYQFDPSNTTLVKMTQNDLDNRIIWLETVSTPVNSSGYTGTTSRQTVRYRVDMVHTLATTAGAHLSNNNRQIVLKLTSGRYTTSAAEAPSGIAGSNPGTEVPDRYIAIRTSKLVNAANPSVDASWQAISRETMYLGLSETSAVDAFSSFTGGAGAIDPYGVAAYTASLDRHAIGYYLSVLAQNANNYMTTPLGDRTTNTFNGATGVPQLFLQYNVGTGNGAHGWGGANMGVPSMHVGLSSLDIVGTSLETMPTSRRLNYWIRPVRIVDENTFVFQIYGGQALQSTAGGAFADYTSGGITYNTALVNSVVSNKYWIIRAGNGSELWRARITNGSTAAEALQNLGTVTSPNLAPDFGLNRRVLTNIANALEYIGNADVDPTVVRTLTASSTLAQTNALYSNRVPVQLEVDNYTNWIFATDKNNPSVTVTIRSNNAGVVDQTQATYGISPVYSAGVTDSFRGIFALSGFGPFAGRLVAVRLDHDSSTPPVFQSEQLRLISAPASLTRAVTYTGTTTVVTNFNTNWVFLTNAVSLSSTPGSAAGDDQAQTTYQATKDGSGVITWQSPTYFNFVLKNNLTADAGILSRFVHPSKRIVSKSGEFSASNPNLKPSQVYDPNNTTIYSADDTVIPPAITIQEPGTSPVRYLLGGATSEEHLTDHLVMTDAGTNMRTRAVISALRLGDTPVYLGIKMLTTNTTDGSVGLEGNAGLIVIVVTNSTATALTTVHNQVKAITTVPDHDFIRSVVNTSVVLGDLESAGPITSLNYYRGYDPQNNTEWSFNKNASTVLVTRVSGGSISASGIYQAVVVKDFAKLSTATTLNDTSDLYAVVLLKSTGTDDFNFANKYLFIRRKANTSNAPLSKLDIKMFLADTTNAGLPLLANNTDLFGGWTNTVKRLFTGGNINGTTYSLPTAATPNPANMAIPQTNFQLFSTIFEGHWSKLYESTDFTNYLYRKTDTTEYLLDNDRKMMILRIVSGGITNAYLYSVWLTNLNPVMTTDPGSGYTAADNLSAGDRGIFYRRAIGQLSSGTNTFANITINSAGQVTAGVNTAAVTITAMESSANTKSGFVSMKFGHNQHITRATAATGAQQTASLQVVFPPDNLNGGTTGVKYRDLYDSMFIGFSDTAVDAIRLRRIQEFLDPYFIPALHANANEALLTNAARQIQANGSSIPVTSGWKQDVYSNFAPIFVGPTSREYYGISYDFNSGEGNGNGLGDPYNININVALSKLGTASSLDTIIGRANISGAFTIQANRAKFLVRTLEANSAGTEGVVRFYYGRNLGTGGYGVDGGALASTHWETLTNQNIADGWQLSNRYMAIKIGEGANTHTAKFVWGNSIEEAKANMNATSYYNVAALRINRYDSRVTLRAFEIPTATDKTAWVGKFVAEDPTSDYTIYVDGALSDANALSVRIWKTSEKPTDVGDFSLTRYQYKEVFREHTEGTVSRSTDGVYSDVTGDTDFSTDGTRVGVLTGFGSLSGSLLRIRHKTSTATGGGWSGRTDRITDNKYIRIGRTLGDLTNHAVLGSWKGAGKTYNAIRTTDSAY